MNIEDVIIEALVTKLYVEVNPAEIKLDDHFHRDLGLDSLGFLELREIMEEQYDIVISDDEFSPDNFMSIETLCSFVRTTQAKATEAT